MSRNIGATSCPRCGQSTVKLEETPRPIEPDEAKRYYGEYMGLLVANAHCTICQTKYLAWVEDVDRPYRKPDPGKEFFDLSYRSTFNDEAGDDDIPTQVIVEEVENIVTHVSPGTIIIQEKVTVIRLVPWEEKPW